MSESSFTQEGTGVAHGLDCIVDALLPLVVAVAVIAPDGGRDSLLTALGVAGATTAAWSFTSRLLQHYEAGNGRSFRGDLALTCVLLAALSIPAFAIAWTRVLPITMAEAARFAALLAGASLAARVTLVGRRLRRSGPIYDVIIVGTGPLGRHTGIDIVEAEGERRLAGYLRFDDDAPTNRLRAELLGTAGDLEQVLRTRVVDEVILASTAPAQMAAIQAAIHTCERFGVPFALPACAYRIARARPTHAKAVEDGYVHYLGTQPKSLQLAVKRLVDMLAAGCALVILSPLLVATALAVKLTSRGPILFRQERVGLHGRRFHMLKFRSMVVNAEAKLAELAKLNEQSGPVFKIKRDPRVTAVGRFIRKYSVDELPQLVNVLRGDMSLVGPRPPIPAEVAKYEAWQIRRLSVRPGLTCTWQVSGRNTIGFEDWMMLDLRYIDHWNLATDIALLVKTVPVVLTGRGAS